LSELSSKIKCLVFFEDSVELLQQYAVPAVHIEAGALHSLVFVENSCFKWTFIIYLHRCNAQSKMLYTIQQHHIWHEKIPVI